MLEILSTFSLSKLISTEVVGPKTWVEAAASG
jgi:hypothetical protein